MNLYMLEIGRGHQCVEKARIFGDRSTRDSVSQRSLASFRHHYVFEHHLTGVCILAKNGFLGDKFMFLPLPIPI